MDPKSRRALDKFASQVRERFPNARIWAFGSRVRGDHTWESDLDVCIVVEKLDDAADQYIMDCAWKAGFENDIVITTVTYSRQEFEEGPCSASPLVHTVLHEGLPV